MGQRMGFPLPSGGGGGGSVNEVTSPDATINVTNPTGPTVDLSIADVVTAAGINITDDSAGGITLQEEGSGGVTLAAGANVGVVLGIGEGLKLNGTDGGIFLEGLPTTDPAVTNELWNDNGVVVFSGMTLTQLIVTADDFAILESSIRLTATSAVPAEVQAEYLLSARTPAPLGRTQSVATTLPSAIAPSSPVVSIGSDLSFNIFGDVDTTNDDLILYGTLVVSDTTGSNVIQIEAGGDVPQSGPGASGGIDWTTGSATVLAGSDLSWDSTIGVSSAAGGIFMAILRCGAGWD